MQRDVSELDAHLFRVLHAALGGGLLPAMAALTVAGSGWASLSIVPLVASARTRRLGTFLAATVAVTSLVVVVLKRLVARPRPCACLAGVHALVFDAPTDFSFPSGHAAGSFAFATFLALTLVRARPTPSRWLAACALLLAAAGIALSRVALGVHFPGDVAAGAVLGAIFGAIGARLHAGGRAETAG